MKFVHIADCHVCGYRDEKLSSLNHSAFEYAIDRTIELKADFLLIAGDLFNTSFPPIESLKLVISKLKELKEKGISTYFIAGSHDYSPSGKTMLDIIEEAGLGTDVMRGEVIDDGGISKLKLKFTQDSKTGAKITGILGKKGMLDKDYYEQLYRRNLEDEEGFKVFLFHTTIEELKPTKLQKMEGAPVSLLPKNFNYYAGGHVHIVEHKNMDGYNNVIYPGPTFPNSFSEIEDLKNGSMYIYDNGNITKEDIKLINTINIKIDCSSITSKDLEKKIYDELDKNELLNSLITLRISGKLLEGKLSDIDFKKILSYVYDKGCYFIMKNTSAVSSHEFEEIKINSDSVEDIEKDIILEHLDNANIEGITKEDFVKISENLLSIFATEKKEGETSSTFEKRVIEEADEFLNLQ